MRPNTTMDPGLSLCWRRPEGGGVELQGPRRRSANTTGTETPLVGRTIACSTDPGM